MALKYLLWLNKIFSLKVTWIKLKNLEKISNEIILEKKAK